MVLHINLLGLPEGTPGKRAPHIIKKDEQRRKRLATLEREIKKLQEAAEKHNMQERTVADLDQRRNKLEKDLEHRKSEASRQASRLETLMAEMDSLKLKLKGAAEVEVETKQKLSDEKNKLEQVYSLNQPTHNHEHRCHSPTNNCPQARDELATLRARKRAAIADIDTCVLEARSYQAKARKQRRLVCTYGLGMLVAALLFLASAYLSYRTSIPQGRPQRIYVHRY